MAFDFIRFFDEHGVAYSDRGKNVSAGHITVHCPWCGTADEGHHLSVNLEGKGYRCFRDPRHRGRDPAYLIQKITGWSFDAAYHAATGSISVPSNFTDRIRDLLSPPPPIEEKRKKLNLLPEFKSFKGMPSSRPYLSYLHGRGFTNDRRLHDLIELFDLRYCLRGQFGGRVIFPIRFDGKLITWTGRHISERNDLRYMTLTEDAEKSVARGLPPALGPITNYLLWFDELMDSDADTIVIEEGPFDAMKTWYLGERFGIVATCLFTLDISPAQLDLLHDLLPRFKKRFLLLDRKTLPQGIALHSRLSGLDVGLRQLVDAKDPGAIRDFKILKKSLAL